MRAAELCHLKKGDINQIKPKGVIKKGKGSKDRVFYLPPKFHTKLKNILVDSDDNELVFDFNYVH